MRTYLTQQAHLARQRFDASLPAQLAPWQEGGGRVYCQAGCASCCSLNVQTTLAEATAIAADLEPGLEIRLSAYLQRLASVLTEASDFKDFLRRHRGQAGPCPFLSATGRCAIYPLRPLACRALLATRNSAWCAVDFADLHPAEREAFRSGLDPSAAWPTHYLAAPQDLARHLEEVIEQAVIAHLGYSLRGNLPLLVRLAGTINLAGDSTPPVEELRGVLDGLGLAHPFLVTLCRE